jgi:hypothetical protein
MACLWQLCSGMGIYLCCCHLFAGFWFSHVVNYCQVEFVLLLDEYQILIMGPDMCLTWVFLNSVLLLVKELGIAWISSIFFTVPSGIWFALFGTVWYVRFYWHVALLLCGWAIFRFAISCNHYCSVCSGLCLFAPLLFGLIYCYTIFLCWFDPLLPGYSVVFCYWYLKLLLTLGWFIHFWFGSTRACWFDFL